METSWLCRECQGQLGKIVGNRLHIRFSRGHEYFTALPASSRCRFCKTLNEVHAREKEEERVGKE